MPGVRLPIQIITRKALKAAVLAKRAVDAAANALEKESRIMERDMKHHAPVGVSGDYRSHIGVVGPTREMGVVTGINAVTFETGVRGLGYPKFLEFGTGPAGRAAGNILPVARAAMKELGYVHGSGNTLPPVQAIRRWLAAKGLPEELAWPVARAIGKRGIAPKPVVFPAYEKRRKGIPDKVRVAVARAIKAV